MHTVFVVFGRFKPLSKSFNDQDKNQDLKLNASLIIKNETFLVTVNTNT